MRNAARAFVIVCLTAAFALSLTPGIAAADQPCGNGFTVGGRIETEWIAQGRAAALGACSTAEKAALRNGRFQNFATNTSIYWNANVANGYAKLVRGDIYKKWQEYNWERGPFGFPTISEATLAKAGGKVQHL